MRKRDIEFDVDGALVRAWFYGPNRSGRQSCIIMAHGLGGTRDAGLEPYARAFVEAGHGVLLFDYRHFGASDGEPRQVVSVSKQLRDWSAALAFAQKLPEVDPSRIGLWGSSFSGGHVVVTAARNPAVAALSAQGPMMDGLAASWNILRYAGIGRLLHLAWRGLWDQLGALLGLAPVMTPLIAPPGGFAVMSSADSEKGYRAIVSADWRNEVAARLALWLAFYRPIAFASRVSCPALVQVCQHDSVAPPSAALAAGRRLGAKAEIKQYPMGHFDIYVGDGFKRAIADQIDFFARRLQRQAPA